MSLSALIFNFRKAINSSADPLQVMNIGNQFCSIPSKSTKEMFLMSTNLPAMVDLLRTNYDFRYSENYFVVLTGDSNNIIYLLMLCQLQQHLIICSYILTVGTYALAISNLPNRRYKIFDSHNKEIY